MGVVVPEQPDTPRRGRPPEAGLPERRRRQIIESAYVVFAERGYEATSIADVAAHASIGQGTVYRYFTSKREILDHVVDFGIEKMISAIEVPSLLDRPDTAEELLAGIQAASARVYELVEQEPEFLRLLLVEASAIDKELSARLLGMELLVGAFVARELRRGVEAGWVRADIDADVLAHTILMLVLPGLMQELRGLGDAHSRERSTTAVVHLLGKGLKPRSIAR